MEIRSLKTLLSASKLFLVEIWILHKLCYLSKFVLIFCLSYIDYRSESPEYEKTAAYWENIFARAIFFIVFEVGLLQGEETFFATGFENTI